MHVCAQLECSCVLHSELRVSFSILFRPTVHIGYVLFNFLSCDSGLLLMPRTLYLRAEIEEEEKIETSQGTPRVSHRRSCFEVSRCSVVRSSPVDYVVARTRIV